jgi:plastocyanin
MVKATPLSVLLAALLTLRAGPTPGGEPPKVPAPGGIAGAVRYTGVVPKPREIVATDGSTDRHSDLLVDPKTRGLRDVVLVLEDAPARPRLDGAEPVVVDQRDMVFVPRVVAVQHGRAVRFDNSDLCNHSVMALARAPADQFNAFVTPGQPLTHAFRPQDRPIPIGCSLHHWMRAWVYVVPHPWFAVSDDRGRFRIEGVPPGKYTLRLHHADTGHRGRRAVEVEEGKTLELSAEWSEVGPEQGKP